MLVFLRKPAATARGCGLSLQEAQKVATQCFRRVEDQESRWEMDDGVEDAQAALSQVPRSLGT